MLRVKSVVDSVRFYKACLDFVAEEVLSRNGEMYWALLKKEGFELMITLEDPKIKFHDDSPLYFYLESVDKLGALHAMLYGKSYAPTEIKTTTYGYSWFTVTDPDGYLLRFNTPAGPNLQSDYYKSDMENTSQGDISFFRPMLRVQNVLDSVWFYGARMGFLMIELAQTPEKMYWALLKKDQIEIMIALDENARSRAYEGLVFYFYLDNIEELDRKHADYKEAGCSVSGMKVTCYGHLSFTVKDPGGYSLRLSTVLSTDFQTVYYPYG